MLLSGESVAPALRADFEKGFMRLLSAAMPANPPGGGGGGKGIWPGGPEPFFLGASGMSIDLCTSSTVSHFFSLPFIEKKCIFGDLKKRH